jgi:hypothetical protein
VTTNYDQAGDGVLCFENVAGAIARAWCHDENREKVMDEKLALAAAEEVMALINRHDDADDAETDLEHDLSAVLNRHSADSRADTPDFALARYLRRCLDAYTEAVAARDAWGSVPTAEVIA